jgi:hypothetical protein
MRQPVPDLWPSDLFGPPTLLPVTILRRQGEALGSKTGHLVAAVVETRVIPPGDQFEHTLVLVAPVLRFRRPLLRVTHGHRPFPVTVAGLDLTRQQSTGPTTPVETASDENAFLCALRGIFHADGVVALLRSLIWQSADHTRPLHTEQPERRVDEGNQPLIVAAE